MTIIDTHAHIYPDKIALKAAKSIGEFYEIPMHLDGTVSSLLKAGNEAGISRFLVHSVAVTWERARSINDFIAASVQAHPERFIGFGSMHPTHPEMEKELDHMLELGLRGVKLHPDFQKIPIDDERCQEIYRLCSQRVPVLLHTGDYRYDYSNPERMRLVLEKFPDCTFIGAHFGGWSVWEEAVKKLSPYRNFYVDTSSSLSDISTETARELIRCYTPDRILYGTDFPLGDSAKEISLVKKAVTDEVVLEKIFYRNASELFDIKL